MAKPTTQTLTPAQVELLDQKIAERHDALEAQLHSMQDQIAALRRRSSPPPCSTVRRFRCGHRKASPCCVHRRRP